MTISKLFPWRGLPILLLPLAGEIGALSLDGAMQMQHDRHFREYVMRERALHPIRICPLPAHRRARPHRPDAIPQRS